MGEEIFQKSFSRFVTENGEGSYVKSLDELLPFIDFPEAFQVICKHKASFSNDDAKAFVALVPQLERIVTVRNRVAHSRPINFEDLPLTIDTVEKLRKEITHKWNALERVTAALTENPGHVSNLVLPAPPKDRITNNLPIPDFDETGFMGRADQVQSLHSLHIWYSGFIQRHEHDYELALLHVEQAEKLDRENYHAQLEKARLLMHLKQFEKAELTLAKLKSKQFNLVIGARRVMWDSTLQIPSRIIEYRLRSQDYLGTIKGGRCLLDTLATIPREMLDMRSSNRLRYNYQHLQGAFRHLVDSAHRAEADDVIGEMETELSFIGIDPHDEWNPKDFGIVVRLQTRFGFLRVNGTENELYFAFSNVRLASDEEKVDIGDELEFSVGHNAQGDCAINCRVVRKANGLEASL